MAKKPAARTAPTEQAAVTPTIDLSRPWMRAPDGFGAAPGVDCNHETLAITPEQGEALLLGLQAAGLNTHAASLREAAASGDEHAQAVIKELEATGSVWSWNTLPPLEDGWTLVAVLRSISGGLDAVAVWAHGAQQKAQPPTENAEQHATAFLIGNLMAAAKKHFVALAVPWGQLSEAEQSRTLQNLAQDVRLAVGKAVQAISSNERVTFRAEVAQVQFKGGSEVVAQLKLMNGLEFSKMGGGEFEGYTYMSGLRFSF